MSEKGRRKVYGPEFKAKVGLEAVRGVKTINEIAHDPASIPRTPTYAATRPDSASTGV